MLDIRDGTSARMRAVMMKLGKEKSVKMVSTKFPRQISSTLTAYYLLSDPYVSLFFYLQVQERDAERLFSGSPRKTGREQPFLRGWRW